MKNSTHIPVPRRKGLRWLALILVLVCELLIHTWVRTESTQAMLRISSRQTQIEQMRSYRKSLHLERDLLKSDARITQIARDHLGLTSDTIARTIYLDKGQRP